MFMRNDFLRNAALATFVAATPVAHGQLDSVFFPKDPFGDRYAANWNYALNPGWVHDLDGNYRADVKMVSIGTNPNIYLMDHARTAWVMPHFDLLDSTNDALLRLDWQFTGELVNNPSPLLAHRIGAVYNFYEENTPEGVVGVQAGKHVVYPNMYDKIDYHVLSNLLGPKFLIVVRPGGDPSQIRLTFSGQDEMHVDVEGALKLIMGEDFLRLAQGMAYQQVGNDVVPVSWTPEYVTMEGFATVSLQLGEYDPTLPLILRITPMAPEFGGGEPPYTALPEWSTYLAGAGQNDGVTDLTEDGTGYLYYTGYSKSTIGLPSNTGSGPFADLQGETDAVIGRLNSHYEMETPGCWLTYFGGAAADRSLAIAYDKVLDRVGICGVALSTPYAALTNPVGDSFVGNGPGMVSTFQAATGEWLWGARIYLPVASVYHEAPRDLVFDADGQLYVVGNRKATFGAPLWPVVNPPGDEDFYQILYVNTDPAHELWSDGFIYRFDLGYHLTYSVPISGPNDEFISAIAYDEEHDKLYVVGYTSSPNDLTQPDCGAVLFAPDFPVCDAGGYFQPKLNGTTNSITTGSGGTDDAIIMRFNVPNMHLDWSTYFGGVGNHQFANDVAVDAEGNVYMIGNTEAMAYNVTQCDWNEENGFPGCFNGQWHLEQGTGNGSYFIARFDPSMNLTWCTIFGGGQVEWIGWANDHRPHITCNAQGEVFVLSATSSGSTSETDACIPGQYSAERYNQSGHADYPSTADPLPFDAHVAAFSSTGTLLYSTPFGGLSNEFPGGIVATDDRIYISGSTGANLAFPIHCPNLPGFTPYCAGPSLATTDTDGFIAQLQYDLSVGMQHGAAPTRASALCYPNPAHEQVYIPLPEGCSRAQLTLMDAWGRLVLSEAVNGFGRVALNIEDLPVGTYAVHISDGLVRSTGRFVKQ